MKLDLWHLLGGGGLLGVVVAGWKLVPRLWHRLRRPLAVIDVIVGRPPRYPGDREAKPGLVERLDRIEARQDETRQAVAAVREEVCETSSRVARVEQAMNGWLNGHGEQGSG